MIRDLFSFRGRYRILHLTWFAFFLCFVLWFNTAPLSTAIRKDLALNVAQIRTVIVCNLALTIPARILVGVLIDRFGPRKVFSCLLVAAVIPAMATALSQNYTQLVWSRIAMSVVGAGFVVGIRMMSEWFPPKEVGTATGIYGGWGNAGAAFSAVVLPTVAAATAYLYGGQFNWRLPIALTGIFTAIYGVIYYFSVQDTPPGKEYWRPHPTKLGLEVTSKKDFWLSLLLNFPMVGALGVFAWRLSNVKILSPTALYITWLALVGLYGLQTYAAWVANRDLLSGQHRFPPNERYEFGQVAVLQLTYFVNIGSALSVVSMLPMFFEKNFGVTPVIAGFAAAAYSIMNLVTRPMGGLLSDLIGRKWTLTLLLAGMGISYMIMSTVNGTWFFPTAIAIVVLFAIFVQSSGGATYAIVPLIKKPLTGQIGGNVGAYSNIAGILYLTLYSLLPAGGDGDKIFFQTLGIAALIVAFVCVFFLKELKVAEESELPLSTQVSPTS